jgi:glycosyltransferase involved in cell wall biosynthesis
MMNADLSVVMPCRDAEAFISDTITHVLALAAGAGVAVEVVVVDDGSTDGTRQAVASLPVHLVSQSPRGVAAARNTGIAHARAAVVGMLDADDRWTSAMFDVVLPAIRSASAPPIVQGRIRDEWPDLGLGPPYEGCNLGSALFRAEVFDTVGPFDESLPRMEDYEWLVRAYDFQVPKVRVSDTVLHYLRRSDGLTGSAPRPDPLLVRVHRDIIRRRQAVDIRRTSEFPAVDDYLGVVPPESERRPFTPSSLQRLDDRAIGPAPGVPAFACVRNELVRLPAMLDHHRRLGVGPFHVVDNGSTDGSVEFLLAQPDVHVWSTSQSFAAARCGTDWLLQLMDEHGGDGWRLVIDADELFVYPGYEQTPIVDVCGRLDAEGADALMAVMVDVYGKGPIAETVYHAGTDPLRVCPWFDRQPWSRTQDRFWGHAAHPSYFGGARQRVFGTPAGVDPDTYYALNKVPLFRGGPALRPSANFHWLDGARVSRGRAALLHWKYVATFPDAAREEASRREHWNEGSQFRHYDERFGATPELSMYDPRRSVRFVDSAQLGRLGILALAGIADDRSS